MRRLGRLAAFILVWLAVPALAQRDHGAHDTKS